MTRITELGGNIKNYCEVIDKPRSLIYYWLKKNASHNLENKKPIAKTHPSKISNDKKAEVLTEYYNCHGLLGEWSVSKIVGGISASKTGDILRWSRPNFLLYKQMVEEKIKNNFYEFLFPNVCWSWDAMDIHLGGEQMRLQVLRDELSRHILNWILTAEVIAEQVKWLIIDSIGKYGASPLVLKRDNELPLNTIGFGQFLADRKIIDLPSPTRYPKYQSHHERGNLDLREMLMPYELDPCLTYSEMKEIIGMSVDFLNLKKPRMMFSGKTSAEMFRNSGHADGADRKQLIEEVRQAEEKDRWAFEGKNGQKKLHRYAVIETLKKHNLLKTVIDFRKKTSYTNCGLLVNQLNLPFVQ